MVDAKQSYRGVALDSPVYEGENYIVQPLSAREQQAVVIDEHENVVGFDVDHIDEATAEGAYFAGASLEAQEQSDGSVLLTADSGAQVTLDEPSAVVDALQ